MDFTKLGFSRRRKTTLLVGAGATRGASFVSESDVHLPPLDDVFFSLLRSSGLSHSAQGRRLLEFVSNQFGSLRVGMEDFLSQSQISSEFIDKIPQGKGHHGIYKSRRNDFLHVLPLLFDKG